MKKEKLSKLILLALEKAVDGYVRLEDFTYNTHIYAAGYERILKKSELAQSLRRLREKGYIDENLKAGEVIYKLSSLGQDFIKIESYDESKWDGKWRIVIFDIPETQRHLRRVLRSKLKEWGFIAWQKSVWVSKHDVMKIIKTLIKGLGINRWVALIESDNVLIEETIWSERTT